MAKRFTDTDKWKKEWFRRLPIRMKAAWEYVRDNCDHAGIWPGDFELMTFQLGEPVSPAECEKYFGDRMVRLPSGKYFLPTFIEFQYGELNPQNNAHRSVLQILKKEGVKLGALEPHGSPSQGAQDKDKDTDKDQDQEKKRGSGGKTKRSGALATYSQAFETVWTHYGRIGGKFEASKAFADLNPSPPDMANLMRAITAYLADCRVRERFVMHLSTFLREDWRVWLDRTEAPGEPPLHPEVAKARALLNTEGAA